MSWIGLGSYRVGRTPKPKFRLNPFPSPSGLGCLVAASRYLCILNRVWVRVAGPPAKIPLNPFPSPSDGPSQNSEWNPPTPPRAWAVSPLLHLYVRDERNLALKTQTCQKRFLDGPQAEVNERSHENEADDRQTDKQTNTSHAPLPLPFPGGPSYAGYRHAVSQRFPYTVNLWVEKRPASRPASTVRLPRRNLVADEGDLLPRPPNFIRGDGGLLCLIQSHIFVSYPRRRLSSPLAQPHNFRWFCVPSLRRVKSNLIIRYCLQWGNA